MESRTIERTPRRRIGLARECVDGASSRRIIGARDGNGMSRLEDGKVRRVVAAGDGGKRQQGMPIKSRARTAYICRLSNSVQPSFTERGRARLGAGIDIVRVIALRMLRTMEAA